MHSKQQNGRLQLAFPTRHERKTTPVRDFGKKIDPLLFLVIPRSPKTFSNLFQAVPLSLLSPVVFNLITRLADCQLIVFIFSPPTLLKYIFSLIELQKYTFCSNCDGTCLYLIQSIGYKKQKDTIILLLQIISVIVKLIKCILIYFQIIYIIFNSDFKIIE